MNALINELNNCLIENQARYMVGDRLSLADISVCSMLAPLLEIKGTPWEREEAEGVSEEWNNYQQNLLDLPLGQYVLRIYQTERNARVDWRGI